MIFYGLKIFFHLNRNLNKLTINPLLPNGNICSRIVKISLKKVIIENIFYERHVYESVDDECLLS